MFKIIGASLLMFTTVVCALPRVPHGERYDVVIVSVKDGDTVVVEANYLPLPLNPVLAVRIYGVDTPEKAPRAQCSIEADRGQQATAFTKAVVAASTKHELILYGWDKFGGRILGDLILDGKSLRDMLIAKNLARPYFGEAKKSWCL